MNFVLEMILSFLFSQYDFSQKKYKIAIYKGILLGICLYLLTLLDLINDSKYHFSWHELNVLFISMLIGIAIMSILYLIDKIFK